jgi:hypothetical protein
MTTDPHSRQLATIALARDLKRLHPSLCCFVAALALSLNIGSTRFFDDLDLTSQLV